MKKNLILLAVCLIGAATLNGQSGGKQGAQPAPKSPPVSAGKTGGGSPNQEDAAHSVAAAGRSSAGTPPASNQTVGSDKHMGTYVMNPLEKPPVSEEALSGNMVTVLAVQALVALLISYAIYSLRQARKGIVKLDQIRPPVASPAGDLGPLIQSVTQLKSKVDTLTQAVGSITTSQAGVVTTLSGLSVSLPPKLAVSVATAINESPLGAITERCNALEQKLREAESRVSSLSSAAGSHDAAVSQLNDQLSALRGERECLRQEAADHSAERDRLNKALAEERSKLDEAKSETAREMDVSAALRNEAQRGFTNLMPTKLMGGELDAQIRAIYQQSMAGDVPSVAVWSTLTSFGSAQSDPGAKDFQLQIVRRLGIVLVLSWKHKGLNEKERHEQLSVWAKCLNDQADGRYNLSVPGLGTPIDRARMACATSATTVREVLCWQVRNSVGANFSLAEVA